MPFSSIAGAKGFERRRTTSRRHVCYIELKFAVYETSTRARVAKVALKVALYPARPHRPPLIGIYASHYGICTRPRGIGTTHHTLIGFYMSRSMSLSDCHRLALLRCAAALAADLAATAAALFRTALAEER